MCSALMRRPPSGARRWGRACEADRPRRLRPPGGGSGVSLRRQASEAPPIRKGRVCRWRSETGPFRRPAVIACDPPEEGDREEAQVVLFVGIPGRLSQGRVIVCEAAGNAFARLNRYPSIRGANCENVAATLVQSLAAANSKSTRGACPEWYGPLGDVQAGGRPSDRQHERSRLTLSRSERLRE